MDRQDATKLAWKIYESLKAAGCGIGNASVPIIRREIVTFESGGGDDVGDDGPEREPLEGEIQVGDRFIWEPTIPSSREHITVTAITRDGDGEMRIESENGRGRRHWNDESRFREACVRA